MPAATATSDRQERQTDDSGVSEMLACKLGCMSLMPEEAYFQLGRLLAELPDLAADPITPETKTWLERAHLLVQRAGGLADTIQFRQAVQNLDGVLRARHARTIAAILRRTLAKAELEVSPEFRGAFITATNAFDIFAAVRRILGTAQADVLLVDAYADATVLTDYAALAPDYVTVRLLTGQVEHKRTLNAAAQNWLQRFGDARPLMIRLAPAETLHDRLVLVDSIGAWVLGASFSDLAKQKQMTLMRRPPERVEAIAQVYEAIWDAASPLPAD
jgi:hypothetical protein